MIKIEIKNLPEVKRFLENLPKEKLQKVDAELVKQAFNTEGEVKRSIAGQSQEPRSVDTGRFLNSVQTLIQPKQAIIFSDVEYAKFLEYGSGKFQARRHFNNSAIRMKPKIIEAVKNAIK